MDEDRDEFRRVLLVGFMGSGKTTVGRILADRLGWEFLDFDRLIAGRTGMSVEALFEAEGEDAFREVEGRIGEECLERDQAVLAPGGGWAARHGRMEELPAGTLSVWLDVTPEEAVRRAGRDREIRPLLAVPDPLIRARDLLAQRREWYRKARFAVDTVERTPDEVADAVLRRMSR